MWEELVDHERTKILTRSARLRLAFARPLQAINLWSAVLENALGRR